MRLIRIGLQAAICLCLGRALLCACASPPHRAALGDLSTTKADHPFSRQDPPASITSIESGRHDNDNLKKGNNDDDRAPSEVDRDPTPLLAAMQLHDMRGRTTKDPAVGHPLSDPKHSSSPRDAERSTLKDGMDEHALASPLSRDVHRVLEEEQLPDSHNDPRRSAQGKPAMNRLDEASSPPLPIAKDTSQPMSARAKGKQRMIDPPILDPPAGRAPTEQESVTHARPLPPIPSKDGGAWSDVGAKSHADETTFRELRTLRETEQALFWEVRALEEEKYLGAAELAAMALRKKAGDRVLAQRLSDAAYLEQMNLQRRRDLIEDCTMVLQQVEQLGIDPDRQLELLALLQKLQREEIAYLEEQSRLKQDRARLHFQNVVLQNFFWQQLVHRLEARLAEAFPLEAPQKASKVLREINVPFETALQTAAEQHLAYENPIRKWFWGGGGGGEKSTFRLVNLAIVDKLTLPQATALLVLAFSRRLSLATRLRRCVDTDVEYASLWTDVIFKTKAGLRAWVEAQPAHEALLSQIEQDVEANVDEWVQGYGDKGPEALDQMLQQRLVETYRLFAHEAGTSPL